MEWRRDKYNCNIIANINNGMMTDHDDIQNKSICLHFTFSWMINSFINLYKHVIMLLNYFFLENRADVQPKIWKESRKWKCNKIKNNTNALKYKFYLNSFESIYQRDNQINFVGMRKNVLDSLSMHCMQCILVVGGTDLTVQ